MRILQINKFLYPKGGAETYMLSLIELLKKNNQEVICFAQKNSANIPCAEEKYFIDDLDLSKFSCRSLLLLPRLFWSFKARRMVKKLIKDQRPDIVHIHNIYHQISPSILPFFKSAGIPTVMTVHDFKLISPGYTLRADGKNPPIKGSLLVTLILNLEFFWHLWLDLYRKNISLFIAPSQFVKGKLVDKGFPADKIRILPHFLADGFTGASNLSEVQTDKYIFSYGRLDEGKGFDDLINAFAEINIAGLKLKIAGRGPDEIRLKKIATDSGLAGKVEFLGQKTRAEIIGLIQNAKIVVNCSKVHETFGLTILEAMAWGKPIIASKVGAIPELIKHGSNGLLYQAGDIGDLKIQLIRLLGDENLRQKISDSARLTATEYSAGNHYAELEHIYNKAIEEFKGPIRRVSIRLINLISVLIFIALLAVPFYKINVIDSLALGAFSQNYPRTANLYWINPVAMSDTAMLAKWDLLVFDMQAQNNSAEAIREIRRINPQVIILAYTTANEMPAGRLKDVEPSGAGLWHDLASGDEAVWHLKTFRGDNVVFWPGNIMMNLGVKDGNGRTYADYLTDFYDQKIMASGLWDGLFFDNTWQNVTQVNKDIDIDGDGQPDSYVKINTAWQKYYADFFRRLRSRLGSRTIIIGNGDGAYQAYLNGRMFEGFPEYWEGGWTGSIKRYVETDKNGFQPRINIINSDTSNTGNRYDYSDMRLGLASALLFGNSYYSFDYGTQLREQLWWYDEYDADLGRPINSAVNILNTGNNIQPGVWQRDFENGIVLANSTDQPKKISFDVKYRKLLSNQDAQTNNGAIIDRITLPAQDGIILLKATGEIKDAVFVNGAYVKIFAISGQEKQNGFFAYQPEYGVNLNIIKTDLNGDGNQETLTADINSLKLYDQNDRWLKTIYPYGDKFMGGINLAVSRSNQESGLTIITAPRSGGSNSLKFFDRNLNDTGRQFFAYSKIWSNLGASVATCDINGDGQDEIITGAGQSGGPHIKIFDTAGKTLSEWFAYGLNFRGGVNVACSDIDADGKPKVIAGAGIGGGPQIRVFSGQGKLLNQWFAYDSAERQGVKVSTVDIDNDGKAEIIASK